MGLCASKHAAQGAKQSHEPQGKNFDSKLIPGIVATKPPAATDPHVETQSAQTVKQVPSSVSAAKSTNSEALNDRRDAVRMVVANGCVQDAGSEVLSLNEAKPSTQHHPASGSSANGIFAGTPERLTPKSVSPKPPEEVNGLPSTSTPPIAIRHSHNGTASAFSTPGINQVLPATPGTSSAVAGSPSNSNCVVMTPGTADSGAAQMNGGPGAQRHAPISGSPSLRSVGKARPRWGATPAAAAAEQARRASTPNSASRQASVQPRRRTTPEPASPAPYRQNTTPHYMTATRASSSKLVVPATTGTDARAGRHPYGLTEAPSTTE